MDAADSPPHPLAGVKVLDLSRALSGPYVGRILGDLGADVVKVELPGEDISHVFGRSSRPHSGLYVQLNAGKRNVSIDLGSGAGRELLIRLVSGCDVVIENFRPGTMERFGLGWQRLSEVNPGLIMLSISGFGTSGPDADRRAYAPVVHAESGLLGRAAEFDGADIPSDVPMALADSLAGLHGVVAIIAALRLRDTHGCGQHLDISMLESMLATDDYIHYSLEGNLPPWPAMGQVFARTDGPILVAADPRTAWAALRAHAQLEDPDPGAPDTEKFATRHRVVGEWIRSFEQRQDVLEQLEAAGLAWADVRTPGTVLDSPTARAREVAVLVDDRDGGARPVVRMPYRFSAASSGPRGGAAFCGEHNQEVLSDWLGVENDEFVALEGASAVVSTDGTLARRT